MDRNRAFASLDGSRAAGPWADRGPDPLDPCCSGKFVTTCSVHLSVDLRVPSLPREGQHFRASSAISTPGGGYVIAAAARAQGVESWIASPLGTGPNSHVIRRRMAFDDIETFVAAVVGDVGVAVSMVDEGGKTASVIAPGVESETSVQLLDSIDLNAGDVVHISGGDLIGGAEKNVLRDWGANLRPGVKLVLSASPAVELVSTETWAPLMQRADIVTMNIREAQALREILASELPGAGLRHILRPDAAIVRRTGSMGCELQASMGAKNVHLPAYPSALVDTTGVGNTHVAVMCASILKGHDLVEACRRANAAGAIEVSRPTAFPVPSAAEIEQTIKDGRVPEECRAQQFGL